MVSAAQTVSSGGTSTIPAPPSGPRAPPARGVRAPPPAPRGPPGRGPRAPPPAPTPTQEKNLNRRISVVKVTNVSE